MNKEKYPRTQLLTVVFGKEDVIATSDNTKGSKTLQNNLDPWEEIIMRPDK